MSHCHIYLSKVSIRNYTSVTVYQCMYAWYRSKGEASSNKCMYRFYLLVVFFSRQSKARKFVEVAKFHYFSMIRIIMQMSSKSNKALYALILIDHSQFSDTYAYDWSPVREKPVKKLHVFRILRTSH